MVSSGQKPARCCSSILAALTNAVGDQHCWRFCCSSCNGATDWTCLFGQALSRQRRGCALDSCLSVILTCPYSLARKQRLRLGASGQVEQTILEQRKQPFRQIRVNSFGFLLIELGCNHTQEQIDRTGCFIPFWRH